MNDSRFVGCKCPACGRQPSLKVTRSFAALIGIVVERHDVRGAALTYRCHNKSCRVIYAIDLEALADLTVTGEDTEYQPPEEAVFPT